MTRVNRALIAATLLCLPFAGRAEAMQQLVDTRVVASDTLRDVALVMLDGGRPTIYYNPILMQRFGPALSRFFIAHEYGHIAHGHTGGALRTDEAGFYAFRQRQELDADCYAAERLATDDPIAARAAIAFFARMGPFRYDKVHPSGGQRAAKIASCLPAAEWGDANHLATIGAGATPPID